MASPWRDCSCSPRNNPSTHVLGYFLSVLSKLGFLEFTKRRLGAVCTAVDGRPTCFCLFNPDSVSSLPIERRRLAFLGKMRSPRGALQIRSAAVGGDKGGGGAFPPSPRGGGGSGRG